MATLTKRQKQIYDYIKKYIHKHGISPTFKEIGKHLHLKAQSTISEHIEELIGKGFIVKNGYGARSIELFKSISNLIEIPLLGTIAAGQPIEAITEKETIAIPKNILPKNGNFYALRVAGDSMIDENIESGDLVVIQDQSTAENGQKVVALLNNEEVTLKKFYKEKGHIRLQPANKNLLPIIVKSGEIQIQGVVVDVIKSDNDSRNVPKKKESKKERVTQQEDVSKYTDKIICGEAIENLRKLPDKSIDLIVADPPYNLSQGNQLSWAGSSDLKGFGGKWDKVMETWDNMPLIEYFSFTYAWLVEAKRVLKQTGSIWVFGTYHNIGIINLIFQILGIEIINEVAWYKRNSFPNLSGRRFTASHETIIWGHVGEKKRSYYFDYEKSKDYFEPSDLMKQRGKQMRTVWDIPNNKEKEELKYGKHPTQKPLKVCKRMISLTSKKGDLILSPFAGAGTECLAAKELDRHYLGFELDNAYVEIANKRLSMSKVKNTLF